jgi:hypothetical protein
MVMDLGSLGRMKLRRMGSLNPPNSIYSQQNTTNNHTFGVNGIHPAAKEEVLSDPTKLSECGNAKITQIQ